MKTKAKPKLGELKKDISTKQIIKLIKATADELGLPMPSRKALMNNLLPTGIVMPIIIEKDDLQLWIDREYIAYSNIDEPNVKYVYATRGHLNEEIRDYGTLSKVPPCILNSFQHMKKFMAENERKYFVSQRFFSSEFEDGRNVCWGRKL